MPDVLQTIETRLNTPRLRENLTPLFCETLLWGRPQGQPRSVQVGAPVSRAVPLAPVAQLSGLPVFRVDWPYPKLPNVTQRRAVHRALAPTHLEHLLAYVTDDGKQATFVWARRRPQDKIELRALPYAVGSPARTTIEQLGELAFTVEELGQFGKPPVTAVTDKLNAAFDVEAVTKRFFTTYRDVFTEVERQIKGISGDAKRLFTQKLFNRLMFLVFLERKGWLTFNRREDYLHALWEDYWRERQSVPDANFNRDRLKLLFFSGLNTSHEVNVVGIRRDGFLQTLIGDVPYLNGGLFEEDEDDHNPAITVPDEAIRPVLDDLFYRFNFTVTESTPLDVEVAVDPEMLGKIFEELVTGRHETGSYYTPKPVVAFMGRQALNGYLQTACPTESAPAIAAFVDEHDPAGLRDPEAVLNALKTVRVCDPACGSGAYLLGMLHELLDLRACLFATRGLDPLTTYQRKLEIIQNNLYGVDIDPFAVNIARLRLWLSLVVDFEDGTPPPLPNLDFKIEVGDSLTAPDPSGGLGTGFRHELVERFFRLKADYLMAHGGEKLNLRKEIERLRADIITWAGRPAGTTGFDWAIEFAEVFAKGGFDIVLTNPPYVATYSRQAETLENEEELRHLYGHLAGRLNTFICFVIRGTQLVRPTGSLAYIVPDTFAYADSYRRVREMCANKYKRQTWRLIRSPVFGATVRNVIVVLGHEREELTTAIIADELDALERQTGEEVTFSNLASDFKIRFFVSKTEARIWETMRECSTPLRVYFDVKDGVNPGPKRVRTKLLEGVSSHEPKSRQYLEGKDISPRGWHIHWQDKWLRYDPSLLSPKDKKAGASLRAPQIFLAPKLVSRQTSDTLVVALDHDVGFVTLNSVHNIRSKNDSLTYLLAALAILNSPLARLYYAIDSGETRDVLPQVHISWVNEFPLPNQFTAISDNLAKIASRILESRGVGVLELHEAVCAAYSIPPPMRQGILVGYYARYPRFRSDE